MAENQQKKTKKWSQKYKTETVSSTRVFGSLKGIHHAFCTICNLFLKCCEIRLRLHQRSSGPRPHGSGATRSTCALRAHYVVSVTNPPYFCFPKVGISATGMQFSLHHIFYHDCQGAQFKSTSTLQTIDSIMYIFN